LWIPVGVGIGPAEGESSFEELEYFQAALRESGVQFFPELVYNRERLAAGVPASPPQTNQEQGLAAALEVLGPNAVTPVPDGVVILDDMMTSGALHGLSQLGLSVGEDVRVATHTNRGSHLLFGYESRLSLLEVDPAQIAAAMFGLLELLMRGEEPPENVVSIGPTLRSESTPTGS
jgi:DNA-binding LacI/PurR family transcriptional regulator